jgi:hypothetical protein
MSVDRDRIHEANEAIDRRAAQRHAAALAQNEWNQLTPEQQEATNHEIDLTMLGESIDHKHLAPRDNSLPPVWPVDEEEEGPTLQQLLEAAAQDSVNAATSPEPFALGSVVFQWILVPSDEDPTGYQIGVQLQIDDSTPAGVVYDIPKEMLDRWAKGEGLQRNHAEHKRFANTLVNDAIEIGKKQTTDLLIYAFTLLIIQSQQGEPTKTAVGEDDGPFVDAPENADEVSEG